MPFLQLNLLFSSRCHSLPLAIPEKTIFADYTPPQLQATAREAHCYTSFTSGITYWATNKTSKHNKSLASSTGPRIELFLPSLTF